MSALDLNALEALASAATPGPWNDVRIGRIGDGSACSHEEQLCNAKGIAIAILTHDGSAQAVANTEFIAAVSPDVVLALIAEVRKLRALRSAPDETLAETEAELHQ